MALIGNYSVFNKLPIRFLSGTSQRDRSNWNTPGSSRNFYYTDGGDFNTATDYINTHTSFFYGTPLGGVPPYSWTIPPKAGGMAMRVVGVGTMTQDLIPQYPMISAITGSGTLAATILGYGNLICALTGNSSFTASINATGYIVLSMSGNGTLTLDITGNGIVVVGMTGSSSFTSAASLFINMVTSMTGSGALSADALLLLSMVCAMSGGSTMDLNITGQKNMVASLTGTGDLAADINAFAEMVVDLIGSGVLSAGVQAVANMSIDMVVTGTGLTTSNVGDAVWASLQSAINNPGTAGAALLAAGSAGDPWSTTLPASYTGTQAGAILDRIQTLIDELHQLEGLKDGSPMTVTQNSRSVGTINLDISGDGETSTTVTRND